MPPNQFGIDGTGIEAWWCSITGDELSVNGFANSSKIHESFATFEDLNLMNSSKQGLYASSSSVYVSDSMTTQLADIGMTLISSDVE